MGIDIRKSDSDLRSSGKTRHEHHWEFERWRGVFDSEAFRKELVNRDLRGIIRRRKR
jgi:hypothetical protein